ncbi:hypothetical protein LTR37_011322 [Vermiconidia calcicola]|uniref:Uncharacterized protein n=1 Tax=Vermiconidia calcicola TaxID=1690605 RepID=A0ACC3N437_9PEZI|nr:hypothetical protein LTR37_011322 [Vermiconidia calcicola]
MSGMSAAAAEPVLNARDTRTSFSVTTVLGPLYTRTYTTNSSFRKTQADSGNVYSTKKILIEDVASNTDVETTNTMVVVSKTVYTEITVTFRDGSGYTETFTAVKRIASTVIVLRVPGLDSETTMETGEAGTTGRGSSQSVFPPSTEGMQEAAAAPKHLTLKIALTILSIALIATAAALLWYRRRKSRRTATMSTSEILDVRQCHAERAELGNDAVRKAELEGLAPLHELETPQADLEAPRAELEGGSGRCG